jgi:hypothetical protein
MHVCYITHVLSCSESGHVISVRQDRCSTFVLYLGLGFGLGLGLVLAVAARESAFKRIEIYCLLLKYRSNVFFFHFAMEMSLPHGYGETKLSPALCTRVGRIPAFRSLNST